MGSLTANARKITSVYKEDTEHGNTKREDKEETLALRLRIQPRRGIVKNEVYIKSMKALTERSG
jgi:hypothetical protein